MTAPTPPQPYSQEEIPVAVHMLKTLPLREADARLAASLEELGRLRDALQQREQDSERLDWVLDRLSYAALRDMGLPFADWSDNDEARRVIDAARGVSSGPPAGDEQKGEKE